MDAQHEFSRVRSPPRSVASGAAALDSTPLPFRSDARGYDGAMYTSTDHSNASSALEDSDAHRGVRSPSATGEREVQAQFAVNWDRYGANVRGFIPRLKKRHREAVQKPVLFSERHGEQEE